MSLYAFSFPAMERRSVSESCRQSRPRGIITAAIK